MQSIQAKTDTIQQSLELKSSLPQQKKISVGRNVIGTGDIRAFQARVKKDSAKRKQAQPTQLKNITQKPKVIETFILTEPRVSVAIPEIPVREGIVLPEKKLIQNNNDWVLGILILSLAILASVRIVFSTYLKQLFNATVNYSTAVRLFRERTFNLLHAAFRLDLLFLLVFSLFAYLVLQSFGITLFKYKIVVYLICLAGVILLYSIKRFAYWFIGQITESQPETSEFLFNVNIYSRVLGIVLFPLTLILAFMPMKQEIPLLAVCGFLILSVYILTLLRGAKILLKKQFSISYLILYLCTLEFLPLLLIYKIVSG